MSKKIPLWFIGIIAFFPGNTQAELPPGKEFVNSIGMKLVRIEAGEFLMGQGESPPQNRGEWLLRDADEAPAHKVRISKPFFMAAFEVTQAQFEKFDPEHKKLRGKFGVGTEDDHPAAFITWQKAVDFCAWLSMKENKPYRLPTEAEWEYACRAGTTTLFHTGDTLASDQVNFGHNKLGKTISAPRRVGSYKPNPWGLFDMHGNVAEWCLDWYGPYEPGTQVDPVGRAGGATRVCRGWSFQVENRNDGPRFCRSANRSAQVPDDRMSHTGFRVVLGEMPTSKPLPEVQELFQKNVRQGPPPKEGPDPAKPFFMDFVKAKKKPTIPPETWGPIFSAHNHFSTICVCPNGDVLAVWYSTVSEAGRECSQAVSRLRAGSDQWEPASVFFTVADVNCHAPVLFSDGQRLYHVASQGLKGWDHASLVMRFSDDSGATWSTPRVILHRDDPFPLSQPCSALVSKDGTLLVAVDGNVHRDARLILSKDRGKTWQVARGDMRAACGGKYVIHPALVQKADGNLQVFLRGQHPMPTVFSRDLGESWIMQETQETHFPGISVGQKACALRLASGSLLLVSMDAKKQLVGGGAFLALSLDDGKTWPHLKKLPSVGGYMYLAQAPNGLIYASGSQTNVAAFNEAWIKEK